MYRALHEVADEIGTDRAIVRKWIKKLGIETYPDVGDARVKLISPEDARVLADHIRRRKRSPKTTR